MQPLFVINNFGQFNHLIHRMLRDLDIEVKMIPNTTPPSEVEEGCRGIILGGGPSIDRIGRCPDYLELDLPVLGICLGHQLIAQSLGGEIGPGESGGYGGLQVTIHNHRSILKGYPDTIHVWASHADEVKRAPEGFEILATSSICKVEGMGCTEKRIFGLQWHPEVSHTENGHLIYENFSRICTE